MLQTRKNQKLTPEQVTTIQDYVKRSLNELKGRYPQMEAEHRYTDWGGTACADTVPYLLQLSDSSLAKIMGNAYPNGSKDFADIEFCVDKKQWYVRYRFDFGASKAYDGRSEIRWPEEDVKDLAEQFANSIGGQVEHHLFEYSKKGEELRIPNHRPENDGRYEWSMVTKNEYVDVPEASSLLSIIDAYYLLGMAFNTTEKIG